MNRFLLFFVFLIPIYSSYGSNHNDSLISIFKSNKPFKQRLDAFMDVKHPMQNSEKEILDLIDLYLENAHDNPDHYFYAHDVKAYYLAKFNGQKAGRAYLEPIIPSLDASKSPKFYLKVLVRMSTICRELGQHKDAERYLTKGLDFFSNLEQKELRVEVLQELVNLKIGLRQYKEALELSKANYSLVQNLDITTERISYIYSTLGVSYMNLGHQDSAIYWFNKMISLFPEGEGVGTKADAYFNKSISFSLKNQLDSSLGCLQITQELAQELKDTQRIINCTELMGIRYLQKENYDRAKELFSEAISFRKSFNYYFNMWNNIRLLGSACEELNQVDQAIEHYQEALESAISVSSDIGIMYCKLDLGRMFFNEKNPRARDMLLDAYHASSTSQDVYVRNKAIFTLSDYYYSIGNVDSSIVVLRNFDTTNQGPADLAMYWSALSRGYEASNQIDSAFNAYKNWNEVQSQIRKHSENELVSNAMAKYSTERAEMKRKIAEIELKDERLTKYGILLTGLVLVVFLVLIVLYQRRLKHEQQKRFQLEQEAALNMIQRSQQALEQNSKLIIEKNRIIQELKDNLNKWLSEVDPNDEAIQSFLETKILTEEDWHNFKDAFQVVHPKFMEKCIAKFPGLSENELRILSLLKLGYSKNEVAEMLTILPKSLNKAIRRFYKKFNLPDDLKVEILVEDQLSE